MEIPIQVAVQIYPGYPNEPICVHVFDKTITKVPIGVPAIPAGLVQINGDQKTYHVTHALPYQCSLEQTYRQTIAPMIGMFMEGYDISVVTYGQHGCGKTYMMLGPTLDCVYAPTEVGIVQQATRDIFTQLTQQYRERSFAVNFGWIEICGDEVNDILGGRIHCNSLEEVLQWLKLGLVSRNQEASHSLITLTLEQQWISSEGLIQHRQSTASFCDLCGTERMLSMNNMDQQISIPKDLGLQMLERIVSVIVDPAANKNIHSNDNPDNLYEQTTLTRLLRDSFGGRAATLMIMCISPLEQDQDETRNNLQFAHNVQYIRNLVMLNAYSDNNLPLSNFIYPMQAPLIEGPGMVPHPATQDTFGLKFAASQWLKLVANAEGLFSKLLVNNKMLNEQDRERIEEWMFLKQECEECLSSGELVSNQQRFLGPIQEEPDEMKNSGVISPAIDRHLVGKDGAIRNSLLTDNESDFDDAIQQSEYLEEKITALMEDFSMKTDELIHDKYYEFLKSYPKANQRRDEIGNNNNENEFGEMAVKNQRRGSVTAVTNSGGRRRSIQPGSGGAGLNLTSAEIERLNKVANSHQDDSDMLSTKNSVCREAEKFLESSNDMHPLRAANANKAQVNLENKIRTIVNDLDGKKRQISELEKNILSKQELIDEINSDQRNKAKRNIRHKVEKARAEKENSEKELKALRKTPGSNKEKIKRLEAYIEKQNETLTKLVNYGNLKQIDNARLKELQQAIQELRKQLNSMQKGVKKDTKALDGLKLKLKQEKSKETKTERTGAGVGNVDTRITHLDYVLKEKTENLRQNGGENEKEESLRHEINNLRYEKDRLLKERYYLDMKLKSDSGLSDRDARKMLECDVVVEVIDSAIEFKNEMICGRHATTNKKGSATEAGHPGNIIERMGRQRIGDHQLMTQLNRLNEKEMRTLLYKCLQKIIDLRDSSRQLELQVLQMEREREEWKRKEKSLCNVLHQTRIAADRHSTNLQKQQEATLTLLLQVAAEDSGASTSNGCSFVTSSPGADLMQMIPAVRQSRRHHRTYPEPTHQQLLSALATAATSATMSKQRHFDLEEYPNTGSSKSHDKLKQNKSNILSKLFPRTNSSIGSNGGGSILQLPPSAPAPDSKVTRIKNKIIIHQNNK